MRRQNSFFLSIFLLIIGAVSARAQNAVWTIDVFNNAFLIGLPVFTTAASSIDLNWGKGSPGLGVDADNFSARMSADPYFYAGTYRFTVTADDAFLLRVNDALYLNTTDSNGSGKTFSVEVNVAEGINHLQVDYRDRMGIAYITVDWVFVKGSNDATLVQPDAVVTRYGDFTRCIERGIHQVNCFESDGEWNAPNAGSIALEPEIAIWTQCTPDEVIDQIVIAGQSAQPTVCSKTGAGYFPA